MDPDLICRNLGWLFDFSWHMAPAVILVFGAWRMTHD